MNCRLPLCCNYFPKQICPFFFSHLAFAYVISSELTSQVIYQKSSSKAHNVCCCAYQSLYTLPTDLLEHTVPHLVKKFHTFQAPQRLIIRPHCYRTLSRASWIQCLPTHPILRSILIVSSLLTFYSPRWHLLITFSDWMLYAFLIFHVCSVCLAHPSSDHPKWYFGRFSQQCCWWSRPYRMCHSVTGWVVPGSWKDCCSVCRVMQLDPEDGGTILEIPGIACPVTQCDILEDLHL